MRTVTTASAFRSALADSRRHNETIGFVPTMGALHDGHLSLVREAKRRTGFAAASIFINPTQFGKGEDLSKYPRDLEADARKLALAGCDVLFAPADAEEMYPPGDATRVNVSRLTTSLCGPFRPGHFEGVATVVSKLFALSSPCVAIFGRKDYQQLQVIKRLALDLMFSVEVVGMPTLRESDGLAMSSRNAYLSLEERQKALGLARGLREAHRLFEGSERTAGTLVRACAVHVAEVSSSIDYVTLANSETLVPYAEDDLVPNAAVLAIACRIGTTRLIDNTVLGEDTSP